MYKCLYGVDAIIIATEWAEYKHLDFERVKRLVRTPIIIDCRRTLDPAHLKNMDSNILE